MEPTLADMFTTTGKCGLLSNGERESLDIFSKGIRPWVSITCPNKLIYEFNNKPLLTIRNTIHDAKKYLK